jgi:hypothetical protein
MSDLKNKVDLSKILRTGGYNLPIDESEVEDFERNLEEKKDSKPADWDNPLIILSRGKITQVELTPSEGDVYTVNNLSMAAREGKVISDEIRKKMNEDRKNSKK